MKIRSYCEKIGHRVSGRLTLIANTGCFRTYLDEAKTSYIIDTVTGEITIRQRRKTMPEFDISTAQRGQEVSEETYNNFLNIMPPISLKGGQGWPAGFQVGEPYCHREDARSGAWRPMFATFTKCGGHCFYQGVNFAGEVDSREHAKEPTGYAR